MLYCFFLKYFKYSNHGSMAVLYGYVNNIKLTNIKK